MSVATAIRPRSRKSPASTSTIEVPQQPENALSPQLQKRWRALGYQAQKTEAMTNWAHSLSWIVGGVAGFVAFSIGVSYIGWGMHLLFESQGWISGQSFIQGAALVVAIVVAVVIWFRMCVSVAAWVVRGVNRWCRKREDAYHLKVNDWWQKVDRELRSQNMPGINRAMCAVGTYAVTENRKIVRVEENSVVNGRVTDGVWLIVGWNKPLMRFL